MRRLMVVAAVVALGIAGFAYVHRSPAASAPVAALASAPTSDPYPTAPPANVTQIGLDEPATLEGTTVSASGVTFDPCIGTRSTSLIGGSGSARPGYTFASVHVAIGKAVDAATEDPGVWHLVLTGSGGDVVATLRPSGSCIGSDPDSFDTIRRGEVRTFSISFEMPGDQAYGLTAVWRPDFGDGDAVTIDLTPGD